MSWRIRCRRRENISRNYRGGLGDSRRYRENFVGCPFSSLCRNPVKCKRVSKHSWSGILNDPLSQQEYSEEENDDQRRDNLAREDI